MKSIKKIIFMKILFVLIFISNVSVAQSVRSLINDGVEQYNEGKFTESEVNFKKGLEKEPGHIATFNLGDSYYKQKRYDEAIKTYQGALALNEDKEFKSNVYHNIGNSYLKSQKYEESIKAYKEALKLNPRDEETKYNLSYALNMMKNNQDKQQQKNDQNKDDQQKNDDKNQDKKENDKNEQQKNDENKNKNEQNKPDQNQTTQQDKLKQPQQNKISKEEAERILNALKNNEQDLQKKLRKQKGTVVKTEKDW